MAVSKKSIIAGFFTLSIIVIAIGYGIFESRFFIKGPEIEIFEPENGADVKDSLLSIRGKAERINLLRIDGEQVLLDNQGFFETKILLSEGNNIISVFGRDKFDREIEEKITIYNSESNENLDAILEKINPSEDEEGGVEDGYASNENFENSEENDGENNGDMDTSEEEL